VVQAWLTGLNPVLGGRPPARVLREADLQLACTHDNGQLVHRVGSAPEGMGVDTVAVRPSTGASVASGTTRAGCGTHTLYAGGSSWVCYLQVLAVFRPLPVLSAELDCIVEPPQDAAEHATLGLGSCPRAWLVPRRPARLACRRGSCGQSA